MCERATAYVCDIIMIIVRGCGRWVLAGICDVELMAKIICKRLYKQSDFVIIRT